MCDGETQFQNKNIQKMKKKCDTPKVEGKKLWAVCENVRVGLWCDGVQAKNSKNGSRESRALASKRKHFTREKKNVGKTIICDRTTWKKQNKKKGKVNGSKNNIDHQRSKGSRKRIVEGINNGEPLVPFFVARAFSLLIFLVCDFFLKIRYLPFHGRKLCTQFSF